MQEMGIQVRIKRTIYILREVVDGNNSAIPKFNINLY